MWPLYYFGGTPDCPQEADMYFCGSACATKHYENGQNPPLPMVGLLALLTDEQRAVVLKKGVDTSPN